MLECVILLLQIWQTRSKLPSDNRFASKKIVAPLVPFLKRLEAIVPEKSKICSDKVILEGSVKSLGSVSDIKLRK